jgi:hypothetical protein
MGHNMRRGLRRAAAVAQYCAVLLALAGVCALIVVQLKESDSAVDGTTLGLVAIALALLVPIAAPRASKRWIGNISNLKVGGVEIALREVELATRIDLRLGEVDDGVAVTPLPKTGKASERTLLLRRRVLERLRLCRDRFLSLPKETEEELVAAHLRVEGLLTADEAEMIRLVLGDLPDEIDRWPVEASAEFLELSWEFVSRLGSTVFDRLARRELKGKGWALADFEQDRGHRPDFLAYRKGVWHLMTVRIPSNPEKTRKRLQEVVDGGFEDIPIKDEIDSTIVVIPDERTPPDDGRYAGVEVKRLAALL